MRKAVISSNPFPLTARNYPTWFNQRKLPALIYWYVVESLGTHEASSYTSKTFRLTIEYIENKKKSYPK